MSITTFELAVSLPLFCLQYRILLKASLPSDCHKTWLPLPYVHLDYHKSQTAARTRARISVSTLPYFQRYRPRPFPSIPRPCDPATQLSPLYLTLLLLHSTHRPTFNFHLTSLRIIFSQDTNLILSQRQIAPSFFSYPLHSTHIHHGERRSIKREQSE